MSDLVKFPCPLSEEDWAEMRAICVRCEARRPYIAALTDLGIEMGQVAQQNDAQQQFCELCRKMREEGRL